ncbi:MAG: glycosyltransferase family 4 protein [Chloroflexi bacterium]|nr:glycosyltransferase family 4 protein [Chloroflexota bacterium]
MRVGIDFTAGLNQRAGVGRLTRLIFTSLFQSDQTTDYRLLYAHSPSTDLTAIPDQPNVHLRRLPLTERWQNVAWHRARLPIWADVLAGGADVFHSPDFVLAPVRRARTIVTVHDLTFVIRPECAEPSLRRYLSRAVPRSVHAATRVAADSKATASDLQRLYDVPASKMDVIYSAADERFQPLPPAEAEAALQGLEIPRPFILTVGTLEPRKNVARLIDVFSSLDLPHSLVVVGARGWLYGDVLAKLATPGVIAPERVSDEQLVALYNLADFLVFPSLYEGFGFPPLEAMACGTPVATSNAASLPEVVGTAALTFEPEDTQAMADAITKLANEPGLRHELSQAGLEQARGFSWETSAAQLKDLYTSLA